MTQSEVAKQIGLRLTKFGVKYKTKKLLQVEFLFSEVDEYEHIKLNLLVETNVLI